MVRTNPIKRRSARLSALYRRKSTEQPVKKEKTVAMAEDTGGEIEMDTALAGAWSEHQTSEESSTIEPLDLPHYVGTTPPSHENSGCDDNNIEKSEIEMRTAVGRNCAGWWKTSERRLRKQSMAKMGDFLVANELVQCQTTTVFHPIVHDAMQQSQMHFRTQPKEPECFRGSSVVFANRPLLPDDPDNGTRTATTLNGAWNVQQGFKKSSINDSSLQAETPTNQRGDKMEQQPRSESPQPPLPQPTCEDEQDTNVVNFSDLVNFSDVSGFVGGDDNGLELFFISNEEQADEHEEEGGEEEEHNETRTASAENDTVPVPLPQQTSQHQSRKQSKPKKRRDHVTEEIIECQSTKKLLIPKLPIQRVVREVMQQYKQDYRMQSLALECLRESSEAYLVQLFEDANLCCYHRSRITLNVKDMRLVQVLRGANDPGGK